MGEGLPRAHRGQGWPRARGADEADGDAVERGEHGDDAIEQLRRQIRPCGLAGDLPLLLGSHHSSAVNRIAPRGGSAAADSRNEKKERFLQKKCSAEIERAKDYTKSKNKNAAIQCLKKKKLYEIQIEQLSNFQLRVHDQIIMLESAKATTYTVEDLRFGSSAVKAIQESVNIDDIENAIDEANEQTENMRPIQEALATPVGASANFDEDELEAELEDLEEEELEEELPEPPARIPAPVESSAKATSSSKQRSDLSELTKLQAKMAL